MFPDVYPGAFDTHGRPETEAVFESCFFVFAQTPFRDGLRVATLDSSAEKHLGARVGSMTPRDESSAAVRDFDGATVAVKCGDLQGTRALVFRAIREADRVLVARSEARGHAGGGLAALASRCTALVVVACNGDDDAVASTLAEAAARAYLGPILTPAGHLVGPKTLAARRST